MEISKHYKTQGFFCFGILFLFVCLFFGALRANQFTGESSLQMRKMRHRQVMKLASNLYIFQVEETGFGLRSVSDLSFDENQK